MTCHRNIYALVIFDAEPRKYGKHLSEKKVGMEDVKQDGMVVTNTNRHEPISTEVPSHLQNSKAYTSGIYRVGLVVSFSGGLTWL